MKIAIPLTLGTLLLAACVSVPEARPITRPAARQPVPLEHTAASFSARPVIAPRGLEGVIGKDINALKRQFGEPRLDVVEVYGRKLQFVGKPCILDAFLYPESRGGREVVTYVDARRSDGAAVDRAACVEALQRR
ncbi:MAG: hypothetical protein B7Y00_04460 [Sphingomonadales bacterium 17-56-6]|nr:MAG: hypothetical protein B7Y44_06140 [Sphingomonadales bacterium 28-55-16]OYZ88469.1 MAG: hypothetical protein B7Y00_04460 [Sphingomonadales bacterium 17-56-6]